MRLIIKVVRKTAIILWAFIIALLFCCLCSCSTQHRLNRLLRHHPELAARDTLILHDTMAVTVPGVQVAGSATVERLRLDTLYLDRNQLHVRTWIVHDTVFVAGECDSVTKTVVRAIRVPYDKFDYKGHGWELALLIFGIPVFFVLFAPFFARLIARLF